VGATAAELNEVSFVLRSIEIEVKIGKMISTLGLSERNDHWIANL
jgi:hypothetical protein